MPSFDRIYLSPHLDDAALSCGGQIARLTAAGRAVLVVTLMAGDPPAAEISPFARGQHQRWQLHAEAVRHRRAEDVAACALIGADHRHEAIPDCIYRRDPETGRPLYESEEALFGRVAPAEAGLLERMVDLLAGLPPAKQIIAPLTVGGHVDHQLTRQAAECVWPGSTLEYYEDYPYVRQPGALDPLLQPAGRWEPHLEPLSEKNLEMKIRAIAAYQSQVGSFFADLADLDRQIRAFAARVGGERLWRKKR